MRVEAYKITLTGVVLCALAACVAPQHVQDEASVHLRGQCLEIFLAHPYQYRARNPLWLGRAFRDEKMATVIFALGVDEMGNQACGTGDAHEVGTTDRDQLTAIAIAKCNEFASSRTSYKINCKIFALGNEIVWGKEEDVEFQ